MMARYGVAVVSIVVALLSSRFEYLLGSRSGITISLCRYVQFLVWWTKAGPARDGALGSAFQILLLGFGLFISCGIKEMPRLLIFALSALLCWVAERRTQQFKSLADISKWEMLCNAC